MGDSKDNVKVGIRIRPLNDKEHHEGGKTSILIQDPTKSLSIEIQNKKKSFTFDYIASEEVVQEEVFEKIGKPIASSCLSGYNGTIFAYGQTGAGKTFTILGHQLENIASISPDYSNRGLLPRCFEYLFNSIQEDTGQSATKYLIKCSYLEIYQEQVNDLLDPNPQSLQLREDIRHGVYVDGLIEETVNNISETYNILKIGTQNRHVGCTSMNKESSRSHSVFTLVIESKEMKEGITNFRTSRFHLIDLAGSERQKATDCVGERLKEAGMINKSLSALGNVINSLVDISEGKSRHVHYRDSKLTFLLKDSLGGNSKTYIIANISPSLSAIGETLSTLKFAQRAKQIKNTAVVNEDTTGAAGMLRYEVKRLKEELLLAKENSTCFKCGHFRTEKNDSDLFEVLEKTFKQRAEESEDYQKNLSDKENYISGLKNVISKLEKKVSHDKMILKFRDATISNLQSNGFEESKEICDLKKEIELLKEQIENNPQAAKIFVENEKLLNEVNFSKEQSQESRSLIQKNAELSEINWKLAEKLKNAIKDKEEISEDLMAVSEKYKFLKSKKKDLESTAEKLNEKIADLEDSQVMLKGSRNSCEELMSEEKEVLDDEKIQEILNNVSEQQLGLQNEYLLKIKHEGIIQELQQKNQKLEKIIEEHENYIEKIEKIEKAREDHYRAKEKSESRKKAEKAIFEEQMAKMAEDISYLEIQYQAKENESELAKHEMQKLKDLNSETRLKLEETQYLLSVASEKVKCQEKDLLHSRETIKTQESMIKELQESLESTKHVREQLLKQITTSESLTGEYSKLTTTFESFKDKCSTHHAEISRLQSKNSELLSKLNDLQAENSDLTTSNLEAISELKALKENSLGSTDKANYYRDEYLKISSEAEDAKNEVDELSTRLKLEKEKTEFLEEALENVKLEFAKAKLEYENKNNESAHEIKHLEIELSKEKKTSALRSDFESRLKSLEEELRIAKNSADSFQELNLLLTQKNAEVSNTLSKLHASNVPLYIVEQLRSQLSDSQQEILLLKEENRQKLEILKATKSQINSTKSEVLMFKKCIDDKNAAIAELKNELAQAKDSSKSEDNEEIKYLRNAVMNKDRELNELKEKGQEYYSQADEVLENMRRKCLGLQNEVSNLREELKSSAQHNISSESRRHRSALRENIEFPNKNHKNTEDLSLVKSMNHKLTEELRKNVEVIEVLQKRNVDMGKKLSELNGYKVQYEEEIDNLTGGLARITDFVFSLPAVKFSPKENSIVESTIKAISMLYEACKDRRSSKSSN